MVKFADPAQSYAELETLLADAEAVLQRLGLPYRILSSAPATSASRPPNVTTSSCGRPARTRAGSLLLQQFRVLPGPARQYPLPQGGRQGRFSAYLNGSGVALGPLVVALLENGQEADGSVILPEALAPYMDGLLPDRAARGMTPSQPQPLLQALEQAVRELDLFETRKPLLAAVSGGADSMACCCPCAR